MFGHCLWWVIPTSHSWNRNVRQLFGKVFHPLHVTIATNVDATATDPRVPVLTIRRPILQATSMGDFHALELPVHADVPIDNLHMSILYAYGSPLRATWTLQQQINTMDWSEPCIPYVECVDCRDHYSKWTTSTPQDSFA